MVKLNVHANFHEISKIGTLFEKWSILAFFGLSAVKIATATVFLYVERPNILMNEVSRR